MVRLRLRGEGGQGHSRLGDNFFSLCTFLLYNIFYMALLYRYGSVFCLL